MPRTITAALLAAAVALLPARADAQLTVKGGLSFASTTESDLVPDVDSRTGFAVGLGYGWKLGNIFEIRPEAFFVQKGGEFANVGTLELNELNIPILLQANLPIPVLAPYAYAGPQGEFELDCTVADTDCVDTESFRWGAVAGLGLRLGGTLSLEGRYNWTLDELTEDLGAKPRTILLLLGLSF
jgi:hypothetical protein